MVLVGLVQMTTVFSYGKTSISASKEKYANITPVCPLVGESLEFGNQLAWENLGDEDVKFYIVQRSSDGEHFKHLAMVQKINGQNNYAFLDKKAGNKQWFYRIIKVNHDGEGYITDSILMR